MAVLHPVRVVVALEVIPATAAQVDLLSGGMVFLPCLMILAHQVLVVAAEAVMAVLTPGVVFTLGLEQGMVLLC
jgi:hypothetical protein